MSQSPFSLPRKPDFDFRPSWKTTVRSGENGHFGHTWTLHPHTGFQKKKPFGGTAGYNYFLLHGGPNRALSLALAEELIRPADWTDREDPKTADYPNYGFYSVGVECHREATNTKTVPSAILETLGEKILKIGKGADNYGLVASF